MAQLSEQKSTDLEILKENFLNIAQESLEEYFSSPSIKEGFSNSQLYFNLFSRGYRLDQDGQFDKLCEDMKTQLGEPLYSKLMDNLHFLRDKKVEEIIKNTGKFLTHTTSIPPEKMGKTLTPRSNLNQFGEKRDNFVFATESESERDFYALRVNDIKGENINWKKQAEIKGEKKNVFIMGAVNPESYTYFLPKDKFMPVVCLDGRFGHEWTATEAITYDHSERNNVRDIRSRNIVKLVDSEKFRRLKNNDPDFRKNLDNPNKIIETLDSSGVLLEDKKEESSLMATLSQGNVEGKNDPRDETKMTLQKYSVFKGESR